MLHCCTLQLWKMFLRQKENISIFSCCRTDTYRPERLAEAASRKCLTRPAHIKTSLKSQKRSLRSALSQTQPEKTQLWHSRQPSGNLFAPLSNTANSGRGFQTHRYSRSEQPEIKELRSPCFARPTSGASCKGGPRRKSGQGGQPLVIKNRLTTLQGVKESVVSREEGGKEERVEESFIEMDYFNPGASRQLQLRRYLSERLTEKP